MDSLLTDIIYILQTMNFSKLKVNNILNWAHYMCSPLYVRILVPTIWKKNSNHSGENKGKQTISFIVSEMVKMVG